jgi:pimeloyl-ACP methyl ester carboxylesterase
VGSASSRTAEYEAVKSDIPTLILAGEFDQNTPSYWGKLPGETLANSHYIEFPGAGHGVIQSRCLYTICDESIL